jgi:hypothetical protein
MTITKEELLKGRDQTYPNDYTQEISDNLDKLLIVMNKIRDAYGVPMRVTSGWRPPSINASTPGAAPKSNHIRGLAVDIADADGKLMNWVLENLSMMKDLGLYFENFNYCPVWVHFQYIAPSSGKRIFIPYAGNPPSNRWNEQYDESFDD